MDCIFCKIANGEIKTEFIYEDEKIAAFKDLEPQAPTHVLIVPKKHIESLNDLTLENQELMGHMMIKVREIAKKLGIDESGYRLVINTGKDGGQTVNHLHIHLLGNRKLNWPAG